MNSSSTREGAGPSRHRSVRESRGVGHQLINAILEVNDIQIFSTVTSSMLVGDEQALYQVVQEHLQAHGCLPSPRTVREAYGANLDDHMSEPLGYYQERVRARHIYNAIQDRHARLASAMKVRDVDEMVAAVALMHEETQAAAARHATADPTTVANTIQRMGGYSLEDLPNQDFEPVVDVVDGVVGPGLTLIAGDPKSGKSWLAMDLSMAVAQGRLALGSLPSSRGPVLHLALEDTAQRFKDRVERMGGEFTRDITVLHECRRLDNGGVADLRQLVTAMRPRLVVIDTFAKVRRETNERKPIQQQEYGDLQELKQLADEENTAILLLVHTNKGKGRSIIGRTAGSHGFTGAADNVALLEREGDRGTLKVTGRNLEEQTFNLNRDRESLRWRLSGPNIALELREREKRIYDFLWDQREIPWEQRQNSPAQIAGATRLNRNTTRSILARLSDQNLLDAVGETRDRRYLAIPEQFARQISDHMWQIMIDRGEAHPWRDMPWVTSTPSRV